MDRDTPQDTPTRLPTLRVATTTKVERVLLYLLARLGANGNLAYRHPALVADVGALVLVVVEIMVSGGWVRLVR